MAENRVFPKNPNVETVKKLLLEDLNRSMDNALDRAESFLYETENEPKTTPKISRTYSRSTPRKRVLKSLENTLYSPRSSPYDVTKSKRKRIEDKGGDTANKSIVEITEQFKKVEEFQLAVE